MTKRALLIVENSVQRRALRELLEPRGWQVIEAATAAEAPALARLVGPQAAFCDFAVARFAGTELCQAIRNVSRATRLVALLQRDCECDRLKADDIGADATLAQPVAARELFKVLEQWSFDPAAGGIADAVNAAATIRFWGVRGSIPTPGPTTVRYGGNTSCVEVRTGGEIIVLDAGTGLRALGQALAAEFKDQPLNLTLLLTHTHWDHIHGLPYFLPIYQPNTRVRILGYEGARQGLASVLSTQMESPYFPIGLDKLPSTVAIEELRQLDFQVGAVRVQACPANHPGICMGYRLHTSGGSIAFFPDNETGYAHWALPPHPGGPMPEGLPPSTHEDRLARFLTDVQVLIMDAQYTVAEFESHTGWGHGCVDDVVALALKARARQLFLFHHDPDHDDGQVGRMAERARELVAARHGTLTVEAAREGLTVELMPLRDPTAEPATPAPV
jgi:phosphoribosyl 1,2-cyclic phosphodiesterase/ActR/RegA family two-component response regulator